MNTRVKLLISGIEACALFAGAWAIWRGEPLIGALIISAYVLILWTELPREFGYLVLGGAMVFAYAEAEYPILFMAGISAMNRDLGLLMRLRRRSDREEWLSFFVGASASRRWRISGEVFARTHPRRASALVVIYLYGIAWATSLLFASLRWQSEWRLPFVVCLSALEAGWLWLPIRDGLAHLRHARGPSHAAPEAWSPSSFRTVLHELPASEELDFDSGFRGADDPRLRLFAADCAEHALETSKGASVPPHRLAQYVVAAARRRARGSLHGLRLRLAFENALKAAEENSVRLEQATDVEGRSDLACDGVCAAFHALCAPNGRLAAECAVRCAAVAPDGTFRPRQRAWQRSRLDEYRALRSEPAAA